ncbi:MULTISPECIES: hypothetical protein [Acidobacterium]|nr:MULTISPECIES: hypothetical protein [Acidobacterium]
MTHPFTRPWTPVECGAAADLTLNLCQEEMTLLICLLEQTSIENATLQSPEAQMVRELLSHLEAKLYALLATSEQAGSRPVPKLPGRLSIVRSA